MSGNGNSPAKFPAGRALVSFGAGCCVTGACMAGLAALMAQQGLSQDAAWPHGNLCGQCGQPVQRLADGFLAEKPRAALWGSTGGSIRFSAALLRSAFRQSFAGNAAGPVRGHAAVRLHRRRPRDAALGAETQSLSFS